MNDQQLHTALKMASLMPGYLSGTLSASEKAELEAWLAASEANRKAADALLNEDSAGAEWRQFAQYGQRQRLLAPVKMRSSRVFMAKAAAAALLIAAAGTGIWLQLRKSGGGVVSKAMIADVQPGTTKARLVLGNGQSLSLDTHRDTAFTPGGVQVQHRQGVLAYSDVEEGQAPVEYHELITPNGGEFQVRLEDGTLVWLNAASSIRFPSRFVAGARRVEVTGEAYFEVARDVRRPFVVSVNGQEDIEVLGTRFNVNAYTDQQHIYTTLLQGAVAVKNSTGRKILSPGQQAVTAHRGPSDIAVQSADTVRVVAWKNGEFDFNDVLLSDVMRQLSKWYDVTIQFETGAPDIKIWGRMKRNQSLQEVITILNAMDLKVRLEEGRKLSVLR